MKQFPFKIQQKKNRLKSDLGNEIQSVLNEYRNTYVMTFKGKF